MKKHPDWTVLNRGIDGQRTDEILARFDSDVALEKPDYVIILAGVNNVYQGNSTETIKKNLLELYQRRLTAGIRTVACTILPYNTASSEDCEKIRELNTFIEDTARRLGIAFCDTNKTVADPNNPDRLRASPDEYHPDVSSYRNMGTALADVIASELGSN